MALKKKHPQNSAGENGRAKSTTPSHNKGRMQRRAEKENGSANGHVHGSQQKASMGYIALVITLAVVCGVLHRNHIAHMFESDRHFSHLSALERELAFRTEMGLYYSYYKTIIEAPTFWTGLNMVMYDNVTEYPLIINTLKRFNLYPEVVVGLAFRSYESVMQSMKKPTKLCWTVQRGDGMSPVQSCEGLGEPSYFYTESVFFINGINMAIFFLFGTFLSNSIMGGAMAVLSFFYNHGECTRVQWTPPLRESFAYPFCILQVFLVTYVLRIAKPNIKHSVAISIVTVCFMLQWQFAQFALMTQTVAIFGTYALMFIGSQKAKVILKGQAIGLLVSYVLLFGNEMLLTSFFASCLLTVFLIVCLEDLLEKLKFRIAIWGAQGILLMLGTVGFKILISKLLRVTDDAHIGDIFKSKFTDFKNFHTMLYTCAPEFDFMEAETPMRVLKTLLAPCAVLAVIGSVFQLLRWEYTQWRAQSSQKEENGTAVHCDVEPSKTRQFRSKPDAEIVYNLFQLVAYTTMAVLIMRLKLFWTPHLCLFTSLLASGKIFNLPWISEKYMRHYALIALIMAGMSVKGIGNLKHQWSIMGEYSNMPMEQLVEWIQTKTPQNAVFAGPMPTMATVKLCTKRPIVNHPHYEDSGLRNRTRKVYTMYSRKPESEVWQNYVDLQVNYAILEDTWCATRRRRGCGMAEIWDLEDTVNQDKLPVCHRLKQKAGPYFKTVFKNSAYTILQVVKNPNSKSR